jgi:hypothetical protein
MSKLRDLAVCLRGDGLPPERIRNVNGRCFVVYEIVRLWCKEHKVDAPFQKLAVTLMVDHPLLSSTDRKVTNDGRVCEVFLLVGADQVELRSRDPSWVAGQIQTALSLVAKATGWRCEQLIGFVQAIAMQELPLRHEFERLARTDKVTGQKCVPWMSTMEGEYRIGIRIGQRDAVVLQKAEPIWLEDDFPLARIAIRGREIVLLDSKGAALAHVSIAASTTH